MSLSFPKPAILWLDGYRARRADFTGAAAIVPCGYGSHTNIAEEVKTRREDIWDVDAALPAQGPGQRTTFPSLFARIISAWPLVCIVLLALVVRFAYIWTLPADHLQWSDERAFDIIGWNLAKTGHYHSSPYRATPGLPCLLAAVYRVAGHSYPAARATQAVLGGALVVCIYFIGTSLFGKGVGRLAAIGVALYPPLIYLSGVLYAEHLYAFLLAATVACLVEWWRSRRLWCAAAAGCALGLGVLCRPVLMLFAPLALAYVAWFGGSRRWIGAVVTMAAIALVVGSWTIRNAVVFRRFVLVSTGFGLHLWQGNNLASQADKGDLALFPNSSLWLQRVDWLPSDTLPETTRDERDFSMAWRDILDMDLPSPTLRARAMDGKQLEELLLAPQPEISAADLRRFTDTLIDADHLLGRTGARWMLQHPVKVLRLSAKRLLSLYSASSPTQEHDLGRRNRIIAAISFYPVLALGLVGAGAAWRRQRASIVIHAAILSGGALYILTVACTRFRLPLDPLWIVLASVGADFILRAVRAANLMSPDNRSRSSGTAPDCLAP
jgi:hypothetical protein